MDTIKTYLDNMFLRLPSTEDVKKAKMELYQMMEDKYTELKKEGKTENEAVGIVISEFGNLEEIAESLGISYVVNPEKENSENIITEDALSDEAGRSSGREENRTQGSVPEYRLLTLEEAKEYISLRLKDVRLTALGILLCITSLCGPIFFGGLADVIGEGAEDFLDGIGAMIMFFMIAAAVALFIFSGSFVKGWEWVKKKQFVSDFATRAYVGQAIKDYNARHAIYMAIGISLCIISVTPSILLDAADVGEFWDGISGMFLFIFVGVGVFFITLSSMTMGIYEDLLREKGSKAGNGNADSSAAYVFEEKRRRKIKDVVPLFWPIVTCIYLSISFLTFWWHITWVIWPIAAGVSVVIEAIINSN